MSNLLSRFRALRAPEMYHGWGKTASYFEGWYYKIVDPAEQYLFALIPGIAMDQPGNQHAFIQLLDGKNHQSNYYEFPVTDFKPANTHFELQLGNNFFSKTHLTLDLPTIKGTLKINDPYPWPKMLGAPGIMGWYSFVPFMECYHGIVSMHHTLSGSLKVNEQSVDFTGGLGYIEKDWGRSFPSSWIWMQTNHFDQPQRVSLFASVARIPWLGSHFVGYIVGFLLGDKLYKFATYTGAKLEVRLPDDQVLLTFRDRYHRLEIKAQQVAGTDLQSPLSGMMTGKVNESLEATVQVKLFKKGQLIFSGNGRNAGLEVAGPVEELLK